MAGGSRRATETGEDIILEITPAGLITEFRAQK
jgi:hypothetical protein